MYVSCKAEISHEVIFLHVKRCKRSVRALKRKVPDKMDASKKSILSGTVVSHEGNMNGSWKIPTRKSTSQLERFAFIERLLIY